jgi:hypothetical protein
MSNLKAGVFTGSTAAVDSSATNMGSKSFVDRCQKCCQFGLVPFGHELDPAIRQIPHETCYREFAGNLAGCIAKANPLDVAGIKNLATLASSGTHATLLPWFLQKQLDHSL